MGILKAEPLKIRSWSSRTASFAWRTYDFQLTTYAVLLTVFGLVMAYSNSVSPTTSLSVDSPFVRGLMWAVMAGVVLALTTAFDYKWLRSFSWPVYLVNFALLAVTLKLGTGTGEATGSSRWITILGFPFQFSELAKIVMIIVFAAFLAGRQNRIKSMSTLVGVGLLLAPPWILVLMQPDLGTSLVLVAIAVGMLFMAGASLLWMGALTAGVLGAIPIVWNYLQGYQQARLLTLLNGASADPRANGYQISQSLQAVNAGGLWGKGLTNGTVPLPVKTTDFVWGVLSEELGFLGAIVVLALFCLFLWRLLVCSWRSGDQFATLVGCGLASMILFQVVVNVGMVIQLLPVTGIPLPFISYGGASLVSLAAGIGIVQSANLRRSRPEW
jgi:rod shape determining protein RodA